MTWSAAYSRPSERARLPGNASTRAHPSGIAIANPTTSVTNAMITFFRGTMA